MRIGAFKKLPKLPDDEETWYVESHEDIRPYGIIIGLQWFDLKSLFEFHAKDSEDLVSFLDTSNKFFIEFISILYFSI